MKYRRYCSSMQSLTRDCGGPQASPLFNNQRNNQQTALPLPATGDQTAPKGCPRQGQPCTADEGETPELRERPGHAMRPATPAVMGETPDSIGGHCLPSERAIGDLVMK